MSHFIPYGKQSIDDDDIAEVVKVLKSDWITQGPKIEEFEKAVAEYCGTKYAVAVSNGTAALHLAVLAAGVGDGDAVITSPNTFVASANCALYVGAKPIFVDINPKTYNLDVQKLKACLNTQEHQKSPKIKAIIPVHFAGQPCEMAEIYEVAKTFGLTIIEDGAHAVGAKYEHEGKWVKIGSCTHSDMTTFSFHPVKHVTTGEGGMILTNNDKFYERLLILRSHGITKNPALLTQNAGSWYYEMQMLGFNYRITDFQCALGLSQWKKVDGFVARRRELAARYNLALEHKKNVMAPFEKTGVKSSWHIYPLLIDLESIGKTKTEIITELKEKNIGTQVHYIPVHLQPYYQENLGYRYGDFPVAERYYDTTLSLPLYPSLSNEQQDYVVSSLLSII